MILAGMSANLCVEAHLRDLLENGFEVAVALDATAAAKVPKATATSPRSSITATSRGLDDR